MLASTHAPAQADSERADKRIIGSFGGKSGVIAFSDVFPTKCIGIRILSLK